MSRKHFVAIAKEFSRIEDLSARRIAAEAFANVAVQENSAFKRQLFFTACGL